MIRWAEPWNHGTPPTRGRHMRRLLPSAVRDRARLGHSFAVQCKDCEEARETVERRERPWRSVAFFAFRAATGTRRTAHSQGRH